AVGELLSDHKPLLVCAKRLFVFARFQQHVADLVESNREIGLQIGIARIFVSKPLRDRKALLEGSERLLALVLSQQHLARPLIAYGEATLQFDVALILIEEL